MTEVVRPFRGVSAERRRDERRARLIDACLDVVGREGVMALRVDGVCAEAGLTKRYLYESFPDLDALLLATADELYAGVYADMERAIEGHERGPDRARAAAAAVATTLATDRRRGRLYAESAGHPALRERRAAAIATFAAFVGEHVVTEPATPGLALRVRLLVAGANDLMTSMLDGTVDASVDEVVEAIVQVSIVL